MTGQGSAPSDTHGGTLHVRVDGRVQGVGFRAFVRARAKQLGGIRGWVRNCPDGSVEVAASGAPDALTALRDAIKTGPPRAAVHTVHELPPIPLDVHDDFVVVRTTASDQEPPHKQWWHFW